MKRMRNLVVLTGMLGCGAVCAETMTAGTAFSSGTWEPAAPAAGGATNLAVVVSNVAPWTVENDLGADGWLTLNALTFATGGCLSGDGFAFATNAAAAPVLTMQAPVTNTAPWRLDGDLTIGGMSNLWQRGAISGTGDLVLDMKDRVLYLQAPFTSTGALRVNQGYLSVTNVDDLGAATIYVDAESPSDRYRQIIFSRSGQSGTGVITNAFVLGTENTANWANRVQFQNGTYRLTGPIVAKDTKIHANNGTRVTVVGGVTSSGRFIFDASSSAAYSIEETPLALAGALWIGSGGKTYLNVPNSVFKGFYGFSNGSTLVCGGENYFCSTSDFATQNSRDYSHVYLDLNGYSQTLGSFNGQGATAANRPFTIMNSSPTSVPTVTITQRVDNVSSNLLFQGSLNLVKAGTGILTISSKLNGTIRLDAGTVRVGVSGRFARTIVVAGGTLDLGGHAVSCSRLEVADGAWVKNGTLTADTVVLADGARVGAELAGTVEKSGTGTTTLMAGALASGRTASYAYTLPAGTVLYFPFDGSLDEALQDQSGNLYELTLKSGTADFDAADSVQGGSLKLDGLTRFEVLPYPETVPTGGSPYTVCTWVKSDSSCRYTGGWLGYGTNGKKGRANNFRLAGQTLIWNYWWDMDLGAGLPSGRSFSDGWHYVVGTYDGAGTRKLYLDGVLKNTGTGSYPDFGRDSFYVGKTLGDTNFVGRIDDLLIANRAFTADEIEALYEQGGVAREARSGTGPTLAVKSGAVVTPSDGSVLAYRFNTEENLLKDASASGADLSVKSGTATFATNSPFATGGSVYLDGTAYLAPSFFPEAMPTGNMPRTLATFLMPVSGCGGEGAFISWGNEGWDSGKYMNFAFRQFTSNPAFGLFPWNAENAKVYNSSLASGWSSVVATWDGAQFRLYLNGALVKGPATFSFTTEGYGDPILKTSAGNIKIGKAFYDGGSFFKGYLAELGVWNRVLSDEEILRYHKRGLADIAAPALAADATLEVADGASYTVTGAAQTLATLRGAGAVTAPGLTVTDEVDATLALAGDLTLADGVTVVAHAEAVAVSGTLAIGGAGVVELPGAIASYPVRYTLFTADVIQGEDHLGDWTFLNVPKGLMARVRAEAGALRVVVSASGTLMVLR